MATKQVTMWSPVHTQQCGVPGRPVVGKNSSALEDRIPSTFVLTVAADQGFSKHEKLEERPAIDWQTSVRNS